MAKTVNLYTIGTGGKSARDFFTLLQKSGVRRVLDIRLSNTSQLAGFTKKPDLEYLLGAVAAIEYRHITDFAPTEDLMDGYKSKKLTWQQYADQYARLLAERHALDALDPALFADACLLCSEPAAAGCHRRLLADHLAARIPSLTVTHL